MTDLRTLRPYLDALAEETLRRVLDPGKATPPRRRPRAWPTAAAIAAFVIVATLGALIAIRSDSNSAEVASTNPRPTTAVHHQRLSLANPDCIATDTSRGCERTPAEASAMLGFDVETPAQIPDGWAPVRRVVRVWPSGVRPNDTPNDLAEYSQVWAPGGVIEPGEPHAKYVQLRQRSLLPTDACGDPSRFSLDDGTLVCGSLATDATGDAPGAFLWFIRDGVYYRLLSIGLRGNQVVDLLNSLGD